MKHVLMAITLLGLLVFSYRMGLFVVFYEIYARIRASKGNPITEEEEEKIWDFRNNVSIIFLALIFTSSVWYFGEPVSEIFEVGEQRNVPLGILLLIFMVLALLIHICVGKKKITELPFKRIVVIYFLFGALAFFAALIYFDNHGMIDVEADVFEPVSRFLDLN